MNVLWIEDFGGGLSAESATVINLFRGLLDARVFDDEWKPETDLLTDPDGLRRFFLTHSPVHSVDLLRNYDDFAKASSGVFNRFDAVALDINLSRGVASGAGLPVGFNDPASFHRKAGFYIFNQLVRGGFPAENICFLTGEKESTFGEFSEHCQQALMPLPQAFGKDDKGLEEFRAWLDTRRSSPYLRLRRGVIEGCRLARNLIDKDSKLIRFDQYLKSGEFTVKTAGDYLATLETILPAQEPAATDLHRSLRIFARAVAHEWENDASPGNVRIQPGERLPYVLRAFGWVMKRTRNWIAHGDSLDGLTPEDAAYLFMVNMRAMFRLPDPAQRFECGLLELLGEPVRLPDERNLRTRLELDFAQMLDRFEEAGGELLSPKLFHYLVNDLEALGAIGSNAPKLLIRMLWHLLAQRELRGVESVRAHKYDCRSATLRASEANDDFLNLLLRHSFKRGIQEV